MSVKVYAIDKVGVGRNSSIKLPTYRFALWGREGASDKTCDDVIVSQCKSHILSIWVININIRNETPMLGMKSGNVGFES